MRPFLPQVHNNAFHHLFCSVTSLPATVALMACSHSASATGTDSQGLVHMVRLRYAINGLTEFYVIVTITPSEHLHRMPHDSLVVIMKLQWQWHHVIRA